MLEGKTLVFAKTFRFAKHKSITKRDGFKVHYSKGNWFAKGETLIPLCIQNDDINKVDCIFSKPNNKQHPKWTSKVHSRLANATIMNTYWAPLKPGLKLAGGIVKEGSQEIFVIDWEEQRHINNVSMSELLNTKDV